MLMVSENEDTLGRKSYCSVDVGEMKEVIV